MEPRIIEGDWDDVSVKHAKDLRGHRVEIRVLEAGEKGRSRSESFAAFEARVGKITRGWRIPGGRLYTAEDFYESRD